MFATRRPKNLSHWVTRGTENQRDGLHSGALLKRVKRFAACKALVAFAEDQIDGGACSFRLRSADISLLACTKTQRSLEGNKLTNTSEISRQNVWSADAFIECRQLPLSLATRQTHS